MQTAFPSLTGSMLALAPLALAAGVAPALAQEFVLRDPGGVAADSRAVITGERLVITDAAGKQFGYVRSARDDSPDGAMLGYYFRAADQLVRFPAGGRGAMQIWRNDRWQTSQMQVFPLNSPAVGHGLVDPPVEGPLGPGGQPLTQWRRTRIHPRFGGEITEVTENPPIPPVRVELANSSPDPIIAQVFDRRGGKPLDIHIGPGESAAITVDRDAGATVREEYWVRGPFGVRYRDCSVTQSPPAIWYDVAVWEVAVRSIYFDRTKNKTNVPDDVKRAPKSLGVVALPPGPALQNGSQIDIYAEAKDAANPGAAAGFGFHPR